MTSTERRPLNPYDFVPLEGVPTYVERRSMAAATGYCGSIRFRIHTLTPLFIHQDPSSPQSGVYRFASLQGKPTIAATSLKGMLRSVHEALTNSTMGLLASERRGAFYRGRMPKEYFPSERTDKLSASEALFGMVGGKGDSSVGYAGRVLLNDMPLPGEHFSELTLRRPSRGGAPKPQHESFYFDDRQPGHILGRKFYYHQEDRELFWYYSASRQRSTELITLDAVGRQRSLDDGVLRFVDLNEMELAQLVYALVLEDGLVHKLGFGKPIGLGSLRIAITALHVESAGGTGSRFFVYTPEPTYEDWTDRVGDLRDMARAAWLGRGALGVQSYDAFCAIARWQTAEIYAYPDFPFFQAERGRTSKTTLWEYQGRRSHHPQTTGRGAVPVTSAAPAAAPASTITVSATVAAAPAQRIRGELTRSDGFVVLVRREDYALVQKEKYQVFAGGANKALLRRLAGMINEDKRIAVSFIVSVDGLADALQLEEES